MTRPAFILALLFTVCVSAATRLGPKIEARSLLPAGNTGLLETMMGDSRRMFATHLLLKADAYFHGGFYPSIFDDAKGFEEAHLAEATAGNPSPTPERADAHLKEDGHDHEKHEPDGDDHPTEKSDPGFLGRPTDWIDSFARNFAPSSHTHLDGGADADEPGGTREIMPWLKLAADLDPNRPEIYTLAAFWLRTRLGKTAEAEEFLREGLRANPGHPAILFELGRAASEAHHDPDKARNIWERALQKWREIETGKPEPDNLLLSQIAVHLAKLEEENERYDQAVNYWTLARVVSPRPEEVDKRIAEIRAEQSRKRPSGGGIIPLGE